MKEGKRSLHNNLFLPICFKTISPIYEITQNVAFENRRLPGIRKKNLLRN